MDPFGEDDKVDTNNLKEHSDLWFWWREQTFLQSFIEWCALMWSAFSFVFIIIGIGGVIFTMYNMTEAATWEYRHLQDWAEDHPEMVVDIQEAIEDGRLSTWEHWNLKHDAADLSKQQEIDKALKDFATE